MKSRKKRGKKEMDKRNEEEKRKEEKKSKRGCIMNADDNYDCKFALENFEIP